MKNTVWNNLRFPGQYFDAETGLHYNWNRYYNPKTGKYITADPIGLDGGMNVYAYVGGNPVNWVDENALLFGGHIDARELYGDSAAQYWAEKYINQNDNIIQKYFYGLMGSLASLWTPCTSDETALTLAPTGALGKWLGRPFWRYIGPKSNPLSPWMTRGLGWSAPYGNNFDKAKDALQMPFKPTNVVEVNVSWYKPIRGPRRVIKHPEWGTGGGVEYSKGGDGQNKFIF